MRRGTAVLQVLVIYLVLFVFFIGIPVEYKIQSTKSDKQISERSHHSFFFLTVMKEVLRTAKTCSPGPLSPPHGEQRE